MSRKTSAQRIAIVKRYEAANPEKVREWARARQARYRAKHPDRAWEHDLRREYGLSVAQYNSMLIAQGSACAICRLPDRHGRRLAVDHDHRTNKVRGLLCGDCNWALGLFEDDPKRVRAALRYLKRRGAVT